MRRHIFFWYCLLLCCLAVLALEFVLLPRLYMLPRATLLTGFAANPGEMIDGQTINALGFTGDVPTKEKAADTLRVLVLGSSTMFNRHMGERLKGALQKQSAKKIELLDAGIRSHTTKADVLKLQLLADYQWDMVLFYDGINDLWANHVLPEDFYADYRQLDPWYRRNALLDNSLLARYTYNNAVNYKKLLNVWLGYRLSPDYQFVFPKKSFINAAGFASLESYDSHVQDIINISKKNGATPILITFAFHLPANYSRQAFLDKKLDYNNPDNYDSRDVYNWGPPDYVREGLQQQNAILRELATKNAVGLIDMDREMSGKSHLFGDVCHFNDEGVAVFTGVVAKALQQSLAKNAP